MRLLLDIFGQTLRTLWAHKLRSFLTMFGIAWGVGSLLLLVGLGEGFRSGQHKSLAQLGENVMFIFPGRTPAIPGNFNSMRPYKLTYGDYLTIRNDTRYVGNVAAVLGRGDVRALSDYSSVSGGVSGVSPSYNRIRFIPIAVGRWFNTEDDEQHRRVTIIGDEVRRNLFPGRPALGSSIVLNGSRFEIIGVMRRIARDGNGGINIRVFVPVQTMMDLFPMKGAQEYDAIGYINYNPRERGDHELARDEVHKIIGMRHNFDWTNKDSFNDEDTVQEEETVGKIWDAMDLFLGAVGLVTLALGAIGIVNIMLVSVAERTTEIGLRKALGATNRSILFQFFLEGAFLTAFSGGIGVFVTVAFMMLLRAAPLPDGFDPPHIVPLSAALAVGSLSIAGTAAGLYPARRAAMLTPVEALRKE